VLRYKPQWSVMEDEPLPTLYNVCQFFMDGSYEYVCRFVPVEEAAKAFGHYTRSVGARIGSTVRVIITGSDDCIYAEWKFGEGYTWPKESVN